MKPTHQRHNYFSEVAMGDPKALIRKAKADLSSVDFDTFVVTGMSGAVVGGMLASALNKRLFVIRKDSDTSHDGNAPFGQLGEKWVFLDDFISSGNTFRFVEDAMERRLISPKRLIWDNDDDADGYGVVGLYQDIDGDYRWVPGEPPEFVGVYLYLENFLTPSLLEDKLDTCW